MRFRDCRDFILRTGMLIDSEDFESLDIKPCRSLLGLFFFDRAEELRGFCHRHPEFHIISYLRGGVQLNRYSSSANIFFLGNGDQDPHIIYDIVSVDPDADMIELPDF